MVAYISSYFEVNAFLKVNGGSVTVCGGARSFPNSLFLAKHIDGSKSWLCHTDWSESFTVLMGISDCILLGTN